MSLFYTDMFGEHSKIDTAIARLKNFEEFALSMSDEGYYVCDSGGKDSSVIKQLCIEAGVKFAVYHHHTSVDHPETVYFIRREKKRFEDMGIKYEVDYSYDKDGNRITMWNLIAKKGFPTRIRRFCCEVLKEGGGDHRVIVTGVRWSESSKRKSRGIYETITDDKKEKKVLMSDNDDTRKITESCYKKQKFAINPIVDWEEEDVWEYIRLKNIPYNPLYDMGYKRVGCVGCPMNVRIKQELDENPKYKQAYKHAFDKYLETHPCISAKGPCANTDDWYNWWVTGKSATGGTQNVTMFDEESEEENDKD